MEGRNAEGGEEEEGKWTVVEETRECEGKEAVGVEVSLRSVRGVRE